MDDRYKDDAGLIPDDALLVIMTVDIGNGKSCEIQIHQGDDPEELAEKFVEEQGLEADVVIGESESGAITLLPMLVDHIRHNKQAAYDRVCASLLQSPDFGDEDSGVNTSGDGAEANTDTELESALLPDNTESHVPHMFASAASAAPAARVPPPPPIVANGAPAALPASRTPAAPAQSAFDEDVDIDDSSVSGRARSVGSTASSTRRLIGTEEEREVQYNALKSQFAHSGKSLFGSSRKPSGSIAGSPKRRSDDARTAASRSVKGSPPLPRVATLKPRLSPPPPAAPLEASSKRRKPRPLTAVEIETYNRLYKV
jgi:hypothetical protein